MARFEFDALRLNSTVIQAGKEFNLRLVQRASAIFSTLLNLLPSTYLSTVEGPNYTVDLKAVALELARLELALEDVDRDRSFPTTRSEFLYSIVGYLLFLNGRLPTVQFDDAEFRKFMLSVLRIFFQGSIPQSMVDAVKLFVGEGVTVTENFLLVRQGASGLDISDQWGFMVTLDSDNSFPPDLFNMDSSLRRLLDVLRPAHTLFKIRYLFTDIYKPNPDQGGTILDTMRWRMSMYYYEDFRKYCDGIQDRDRAGHKVNQKVQAEDHSKDFLPRIWEGSDTVSQVFCVVGRPAIRQVEVGLDPPVLHPLYVILYFSNQRLHSPEVQVVSHEQVEQDRKRVRGASFAAVSPQYLVQGVVFLGHGPPFTLDQGSVPVFSEVIRDDIQNAGLGSTVNHTRDGDVIERVWVLRRDRVKDKGLDQDHILNSRCHQRPSHAQGTGQLSSLHGCSDGLLLHLPDNLDGSLVHEVKGAPFPGGLPLGLVDLDFAGETDAPQGMPRANPDGWAEREDGKDPLHLQNVQDFFYEPISETCGHQGHEEYLKRDLTLRPSKVPLEKQVREVGAPCRLYGKLQRPFRLWTGSLATPWHGADGGC